MDAIIDYRGKSPQKRAWGIPLITAKVVKGGRIEPPNEFIDAADYDTWMRRGIPLPGDVVLTTEAPLGEVAQLGKGRLALAQRLIALRGKPRLLDNTFLKFLLQSTLVQQQLHARASGTTVLGIKQSELRKIALTLPPLSYQRSVVNILGTLDCKIELNRKMNETLEAMARAIFKSWFVDFDPARAKADGRQPIGMDAATAALFPDSFEDSELGEIPKGWKVDKSSRLLSISRDSISPGAQADRIYNHFSIPAYDEGKTPVLECGREIKSNKFIVPPNSVLLSKLNPRIPRVWLPLVRDGEHAISSTEFLVCLPRQSASREYLYALFASHQFQADFATMVTGTSGSHQRVKSEFLEGMHSLVPEKSVIEAFTKQVQPLYASVSNNLMQNQTLSGIRDALLPKLMSGELPLTPHLVGTAAQT